MTPMMYASSKCPACGSRDIMNVDMTVVESALAFSFCTTCEWKGWAHGGQSLSLSSILGLVTTH